MVDSSPMDRIEEGQAWDDMAQAWLAILRWAANQGLSFKVTYADKKRWLAECKERDKCHFRIRLTYVRKAEHIKIAVYEPHTWH